MSRRDNDLFSWIFLTLTILIIIYGCVDMNNRIIVIEKKIGVSKEQPE